MQRLYAWLRWVLMGVLACWGCVAQPVAPAGGLASVRVLLSEDDPAYRLQAVVNPDWRRAVATLSRSGAAPLTAEAARGGTLAFSGVPTGSGYAMTIRLYRPTPEGREAELRQFTRADLTLTAGLNDLALTSFTTSHPELMLPGARALDGAFVTSIPAVGPNARFKRPEGIAVASNGTYYVADSESHSIRKVTPDGTVTTLAGAGTYGFADGLGRSAMFSSPKGVALDASGTLYVADAGNNRIRKVTTAGEVTTLAGSGTYGFADGVATVAQFKSPEAVVVDPLGTVYVSDRSNQRIRKIAPTGAVTTLAGAGSPGFLDGPASSAQFSDPGSLAFDLSGNLLVADTSNHRIRRVTPAGDVTTLAGSGSAGYANGPALSAQFFYPKGLAVNASGEVFLSDDSRIRKISTTGQVTTFSGIAGWGFADGDVPTARFNSPVGISVDAVGNLFIADSGNQRIRKLSPTGIVSTLAGSGPDVTGGMMMGMATWTAPDGLASAASLYDPIGVSVDGMGNIYVAEDSNCRIRKVSPEGTFTTLAGGVTRGNADGVASAAQFASPSDVAVDADGTVYVADTSNHLIRKVTPAGVVSVLAGSSQGFVDGTGTAAAFNGPYGLAIDASGTLLVADSANNCIRKVTRSGVVTTLAGTGAFGFADGTATTAQFYGPRGVAIDPFGNVYVSDTYNQRIRKVTPAGNVTTLAGSGSAGFADGTGLTAQFSYPWGLEADSAGNVYVADPNNRRIRKVTPSGVVTTLAGSGSGFADGPTATSLFALPADVAIGPQGHLYIADSLNHVLRRIHLEQPMVTPIISGLSPSTDSGPSATDGVTAMPRPTLRGTASPGSQVRILRDGATLGSATPDAAGQWSFTPTTPLVDGVHPLRALGVDAGGGKSAFSSIYELVIDATPPQPPSIGGLTAATDTGVSATDGITTITTPTLTGTAEALSTVLVSVGGSLVGSVVASPSGDWSYSVSPPLSVGTYVVTMTARDSAGNLSSVSTSYSFEVVPL